MPSLSKWTSTLQETAAKYFKLLEQSYIELEKLAVETQQRHVIKG